MAAILVAGFPKNGEVEGSASLLVHLLLVEFELLTLKDVAVGTTNLARAGGDAGKESATLELISDFGVDDAVLLGALQLGLNVTGLLFIGTHLVGLFLLLRVQLDVVLAEVVEAEGVRIDGDNSVLDDGLRSDELVVRGVVDDVKNLALLGNGLGAPAEVASIDAESSELVVSASAANRSDARLTKLSHGRLAAHLELSLLLVDRHAAGGGSSLVPRVSVNSHDPLFGVC